MTVYLVDFENVRSAGLKGVENLNEEDKVVIFYSKNADAITFDVHMLLSKSKAEIETYMILRGGRNSLDFQLSTYLGYLVMENRYRDIVIVSGDKGFLCAINFWEENRELCNVHIQLRRSIEAFECNEPYDDLENDNDNGKFIEKISVIPSKSNTKETVRLNAGGRDFSTENETEQEKTRRFDEAENKEQDTGIDADKSNVVIELEKKPSDPKRTQVFMEERTRKQGDNIRIPFLHNTKASWYKESYDKPVEGLQNDNVRVREKLISAGSVIRKKNPPQPQNPTSKNKIFASEVKLNIVEDVQEIVGEKYGEEYVPMLVEVIGKSTGKQHLYRMLVSRLGQDIGKDIYMMIKGQYANLKRK